MLTLVVANTEVQSASVPVRWCVTQDTFEFLKGKEAKNPHILLVTTNGSKIGGEERYLVPLDHMMHYVRFRNPGENKVFAMIVWDYRGKWVALWNRYLRKVEGWYQTNVIAYAKPDDDEPDRMLAELQPPVIETAELTVEVPQEVFAKEPPKWEQAWVNAMFRDPPRDQCDYRRRRIVAYTVLPLWKFGAVMPFRWVAFGFLLLTGNWKAARSPLYHPFKDDTEHLWYWLKREDNIFVKLLVWLSAESTAEQRARRDAERQTRWQRRLEEMCQLVSCENLTTSPYSVLSARRKTHLRFLDFKARVCKPFAGG